MTDTEYLGMEDAPSEGFMQPKRYRILFRCGRCGHEYARVAKSANIPDVPCPKLACKMAVQAEQLKAENLRLTKMLDEQRAPGQIGNNNLVKAVDATAEIVMKEHHMTDLKDNIRQGESMAPKLRQNMQVAADNFFNVPANNQRQAAQMKRLGQRAIAGAFKDVALNPVSVMGGMKGESALRMVRKEPLK